eukprot:TRINITY_DN14829_c0_g1_i1.p1 TRINITY_DN14829_c0_g1~~TRINITY_DN14829_c0_g1_i1.p1  ORF type:complete len:145 (-),score=28.06 TRINITY_DN14829_c0_g1_i1:163-597(-)
MSDTEEAGLSYKQKVKLVAPIANPLAGKKLTKKTLKAIKKISKTKQAVRRGVKEVSKAIRKGEKGLVILAGDISPIDVITHLPVACEDANIPYVYVPSRVDLGAAGNTKRPTSVILINAKNVDGSNAATLKELLSEVKAITPKF